MNLEPSAIASATANATATATTTATSSAAATGSATVSASASTRGTASASDTASASEAHVPRLNFTASYVAISEHSRVASRNFNNNFLARYQSDNLHLLQRRQRNIRPLSLVLLSPGF